MVCTYINIESLLPVSILLSLNINTYVNVERTVYLKYTSEFENHLINATVSILKVHFMYTSECENKYVNLESILQVCFFSLNINSKVWKVHFNYTSEIDNNKYINFKSLLQVYFLNLKEIQIHFRSIIEIYFITKFLMDSKYT